MKTEKLYDYIIYSAGFDGVVSALHFSRKGKKVLLLNFYGFMGGSVTESLNCLQYFGNIGNSSITSEILTRIKNEKKSFFFCKEEEYVINPETVKIVLQQLVEESTIDLLFHIVPVAIKVFDNEVEMSLSGKEGLFKVKGKVLIDASEEFSLLKLSNLPVKLESLFYNMFITKPVNDDWMKSSLIFDKLLLDDGRYWVSLNLQQPGNIFFVENNSQMLINKFEEEVQNSKARIQLLAPQTEKIFSINKKSIADNFFHIESLLPNNFMRHELLMKTNELESKLAGIK